MSTKIVYDLTLESIKNNFIDFLKAQDDFKDYDFEGSGITSLIESLCHSILYNNYYLNMVANDLFLNSAENSNNIHKLSNFVNYLPRRKKAASIEVDIERKQTLTLQLNSSVGANVNDDIASDNGDPGVGVILSVDTANATIDIEVTSGTFAQGDNVDWGVTVFVSTDAIIQSGGVTDNTSTTLSRNTIFTFNSLSMVTVEDHIFTTAETKRIRLYEGEWKTESHNGDGTDFQFKQLAYTNEIDNDNIIVTVYDSSLEENFELNMLNKKITNLDNKRNYYLEHLENLFVKFEDGSVAFKPEADDIVTIEYLYTQGASGNGVASNSISTMWTPLKGRLIYTLVSTITENGTTEEADAGIKLNAPLYYTTQGRAVITEDHNILIKSYSQIETLKDIYIWGGEKEIVHTATGYIVEVDSGSDDALDLGWIYISALKSDLTYLSQSEITDIKEFLDGYKILSLFYKFVHSNIIKIIPTINVELVSLFDVNDSLNTLKSGINSWFDDLVGLNKTFYLSNLINYVDDYSNVKHTKISVATECEIRNDVSEFYKVIRLGGATVVDSITGTINDETLAESSGTISLTNNKVLTVGAGEASHAECVVDNLMAQQTTGAIGIIKKIDTIRDKISYVNVQKLVLGGGEGVGFTEGGWISSDNASPGKGRVEKISVDTLYIRVISGTFAATDNVDDAEIFVSGIGTISSVASGTWSSSNNIDFNVDTYTSTDATPTFNDDIGTINNTTGFIILDGYYFGGADDDIIDFNFTYSDTSKIVLEKESFFNYDDTYSIGVLN